jgi:DHA1 family bicyclomycin/chloramphenicol resistance-like MFS transporter
MHIWLPESNPDRDRYALRPHVFLRTYVRIWRTRQFVVMAVLSGLGFSTVMSFVTVAPFYVIDVHGYAPEVYGLYQGGLVVGYIAGSLFAHRAVVRLGLAGLLRVGVWSLMVGGVGMFLLATTGLDDPLFIAGPILAVNFGLALIFATAPLQALAAVSGGRVGAVSAALGTTESGIASLAALGVGLMAAGSAWPMALGVAIPAAIALALFLLVGRGYLNRDQAAPGA